MIALRRAMPCYADGQASPSCTTCSRWGIAATSMDKLAARKHLRSIRAAMTNAPDPEGDGREEDMMTVTILRIRLHALQS